MTDCPCFRGAPAGGKGGFQAAVSRSHAGALSVLARLRLRLRAAAAGARYLFGSTRRRKPGERPAASISPSGRRRGGIRRRRSFISCHLRGLISTRKRPKQRQKKKQRRRGERSQTRSVVIPVGCATIRTHSGCSPSSAEAPPTGPPPRWATPNQMSRLNLEFRRGPIGAAVT